MLCTDTCCLFVRYRYMLFVWYGVSICLFWLCASMIIFVGARTYMNFVKDIASLGALLGIAAIAVRPQRRSLSFQTRSHKLRNRMINYFNFMSPGQHDG